MCFPLLSPNPKAETTPAQRSFDLGKVMAGSLTTRTVSVKNIGSAKLIITRVVSSCQCTASEVDKRVLAPNESAQLKITIIPRVAGSFSQQVLVGTSDVTQPTLVFKFHGYIQQVSN